MSKLKAWLASRWVTGAGFMSGALLALVPVLGAFSLPLFLIFLHSPGYMVHQVEEHTDDRFRTFTNQKVFGGRDALSVTDVLVINLPLVWGLNLGSLYAAFAWGPGAGLVAPYAMLVNAIAHLGAAARFRAYNPGLITAIVLFIPLSLTTIYFVGREPAVGFGYHALGLAGAILIHALIIVAVLIRYRSLAPALKS